MTRRRTTHVLDRAAATATQHGRVDARLVETLVFRILVATNLLAGPFTAQIGRRYKLTLAAWRCMMVIAAEPGSSGEDVARCTGLDRMSASRGLRALERAGYANRIVQAANQKRYEWQLTPKGWSVFDEIATTALARERAFLRPLSPSTVALLTHAFDEIIAELRPKG